MPFLLMPQTRSSESLWVTSQTLCPYFFTVYAGKRYFLGEKSCTVYRFCHWWIL